MDFIERLHHNDIDGTPIGDIRLYFCGRRLNAPDHRFGPAARDHFWIIYLKEGSGIYSVDTETWSLSRGTVFVAFPNRRIFYKADPGSIWSICWVSIGGERLEECLSQMGISEENPLVHPDYPAAVEGVFAALLYEVSRDTLASQFACTGLIYKLLSLLAPQEASGGSRDYLDEAVFYLSNNYDRPIGISDAAAHVGLERSYFARLFRARMGQSPSEWLNAYRMNRAAALLADTDLKIGEIARSVGFEDPLYFSRRFCKTLGVSPSAYRRAHGAGLDLEPDLMYNNRTKPEKEKTT